MAPPVLINETWYNAAQKQHPGPQGSIELPQVQCRSASMLNSTILGGFGLAIVLGLSIYGAYSLQSAGLPPLSSDRTTGFSAREPGSREVDDPPIPRNSSAAVSAPGARSFDSQPSMESDGPPSVDPDSMPGSEKQSPSAPKHSSTGTNVGRYHVKVSLARSEAQAEAASQGFQLRYRDDLRGLTVILSRDNVGPKGVSYGLSIGPFSSAREAARFCARVKQSARCIVRKRGTIAARDTKGTAQQSSGWQW